MPDDLTFLMGKFPAALPGGLRYARNHMWCRTEGDRHRFGFTSYAVRLMQDVYFLDWSLADGDAVHLLQEIGHIETSKAESDLFAPIAAPWRSRPPPPSSWTPASTCRSSPPCTTSAPTTPAGSSWTR